MIKEDFNFSKLENQESFQKQSQEEQEKIEEKDKDKEAKKEIVLTPEQERAKKELIECLSQGYIDDACEIKETFALPEEFVQEAAKKGIN